MKVQTDGLELDLRTTNPPGPFSPLIIKKVEQQTERLQKWTEQLYHTNKYINVGVKGPGWRPGLT